MRRVVEIRRLDKEAKLLSRFEQTRAARTVAKIYHGDLNKGTEGRVALGFVVGVYRRVL
jgi:hypothetical protein